MNVVRLARFIRFGLVGCLVLSLILLLFMP